VKTEPPIGPYDSLPDAVLGAQKRGNTPFMEYQGHTCRLSFYTSTESFGIFVESANGLTMEIPLPHVTDVAEYVKHGGRTRGEIQRGELGLDV